MTRQQKKNLKKKLKRKQKRENEAGFVVEEEITGVMDRLTLEEDDSSPVSHSEPNKTDFPKLSPDRGTPPPERSPDSQELMRRTRALRKKIKQIEELELRIASGDIQRPDRDQLNKIDKKEEFREELQELLAMQGE